MTLSTTRADSNLHEYWAFRLGKQLAALRVQFAGNPISLRRKVPDNRVLWIIECPISLAMQATAKVKAHNT